MRELLSLLAMLTGVYSLIIFIRIIISWFGGMVSGKPVEILEMITDPYLNWWKRNLRITFGFLDFSVLAAIVFLSFLQNTLYTLASSERMTLGFMLSQIILSLWTILSFIIGFFIVLLILRIIAYLLNLNIYNPFWGMVDSLSKPFMYKINRIIFGNKIIGYLHGMIIALLLLIIFFIAARFLVFFLAGFVRELPF